MLSLKRPQSAMAYLPFTAENSSGNHFKVFFFRLFQPHGSPIQGPEIKELVLRFQKGYYNRPQTVAEIKRRPIATIQRVSTARKENLVKRCIGNPKHRVRQDRFYLK